ncbi:Uu.00g061120.m01.CDS01 [Anthostomella pinea]|uniref:Uu.00g061120.m01.CDS01 n=1 Tax=Anthostomella pinea TaxID=933095 RepID=A0AAI8VTJ9_9PEZI|nr:Uu.00g061120.m01.CDS01 [Anthostomella pinea]
MGIASGIGHLFQSVIEMIQGLFGAILSFFGAILNGILSLFQGFVNFVEGTLGFAIHNFFILGTVAAAVFAYMLYTQRQGTAPISSTLKNKKAA